MSGAEEPAATGAVEEVPPVSPVGSNGGSLQPAGATGNAEAAAPAGVEKVASPTENQPPTAAEGDGDAPAEDGEPDEEKPPEPVPSALKGKSGRDRGTDLKLRFNDEPEVFASPSMLTMFTDETENEEEEMDLFERLYDEARKRMERAEEREKKLQEEAEVKPPECTFSPTVSATAVGLGKYKQFSEFLEFQEESRKKSAKKMVETVAKRINGLCPPLFDDMPRKESRLIVAYLEKERRYRGPVRGWRARYKKYVLKLMQRQEEAKRNPLSRYEVNSVHSGITCDEAVFQRLYEEAHVREAALRVVEQTQLEKEARELFRPRTNSSRWFEFTRPEEGSFSGMDASTYSSRSSVFEELYAYGEEYRRRHEMRVTESSILDEECTFKPSTNQNSRRIIMERAIMRANGELPERPKRHGYDDEEGGAGGLLTYAPPKPPAKCNVDVFCSRVERGESERQERIASLRRASRLEELAECTFRPSITRTSQSIAAKHGYGRVEMMPARQRVSLKPHSPPQSGRPRGQLDPRSQYYDPASASLGSASGVRRASGSFAHDSEAPEDRRRAEATSPHPRISSIRPDESGISGLPPPPQRSSMTRLQEPSPIHAKRALSGVDGVFAHRLATESRGAERSQHTPSIDEDFAGYLQNLESELRTVISEWTAEP